MWPTIDPATNTLYAGTGNPSPDFIASVRGGCDPYTNSLIALNATTGALKWAHADICIDGWDYDSAHSPLYFDLTVGGQAIHAVGHANKSGFFEVLDAQTGKLISKSPHLTPYTEPHLLPTPAGVNVCPGIFGGIQYSPASFDPQTGAIYQDALSICDRYVADSAQQASIHNSGQQDIGGDATLLKTPPPTGYLASIDAATGKVRWEDKLSLPSVGGTLSTAGGLVFTPDDNGNLYAADARTGKILWNANLGLPFGSAPMTYKIGKTQYVAVVAGGSATAAAENVPKGGELVVLKLGGGPVHKFPPVNPLASPGLRALPDLSQYT
jgi:glucose dehydrogenase